MKKLLLAIAALATTAGSVLGADLVTPTGTRTEVLAEVAVLTGVGRAMTYDVTTFYDYYIDGSTVYIQNFITGKGYFKGTLDASNNITVQVPQALYEENGVTYYLKTANFGGSGEALLDEQFTMQYYPTNGRINCLSYGMGVYAGDNTECERAVCKVGLRTNQTFGDLFQLARVATDVDGNVYGHILNARYLDKKTSDYLAVEGLIPGSKYGQMFDDYGSKWHFADSQFIGMNGDAYIFTAAVNDNGELYTITRNFIKTTANGETEWNLEDGSEIICWNLVSYDDYPVAAKWNTFTSIKVSTDLSILPTTDIKDVETTQATEVARYNMAGQQISENTPGIAIVKMSDGTAKKVLVK